VVPRPRCRGGGWRERSGSRDAIRARVLPSHSKKNVLAPTIPHQTNRRPLLPSSSKGRQNADRRVVKDPHLRMRLASSGTRSPVGVPPRLSLRRTNATAQPQAALPGTWLKDGRYPSPPVPVQRASRRPVIMPAGRLPRAARERGYEPRPRAPLSLRHLAVTGDVPLLSEIYSPLIKRGRASIET
jgi:hypothetical protein